MKAAVFYGPHQPLRIETVPDPVPGPDEILVQVAACGLCHTDLHYIDHDVPTAHKPPLILGHEASGTVTAVGERVKGFAVGAPVLVPAVFSCGECRQCRRGRENICEHMVMPGNHVNGAYAELMTAPAKDVLHLPQEIPLVDACIIADAVSTPYNAVKNRGRVQPGDTVAVFGCGGVGLNVVQIAAASGAKVIAVDISDEKLENARRFGAEVALKGGEGNQVSKEIKRLTGGGVDIAFEAIGYPPTIVQAFDSLARGGRLVQVGYCQHPVELNVSRLMFVEMEVLGSLGCSPLDYVPLIDLVARGRLKLSELISHRVPLERINEGLDHLRNGQGIRNIVVMD